MRRMRLTYEAPFVYNEWEPAITTEIERLRAIKEKHMAVAEKEITSQSSSMSMQDIHELGAAAARGQHPLHHGGRLGPPDVVHVRRRPDGRAAGQVPASTIGPTPSIPNNDHLIFSKGHACPLLYSMFKAAGAITDEELLTLRKFGSPAGRPPQPARHALRRRRHRLARPGLPIGVGMALDGKYLDKLPFNVWVVLGDSEMAEGSIWEALDKAIALQARTT